MCNKISTNSFGYSKNFFLLILSIAYFKILPLEKFTFVNLTLDTNIFLLLFLNLVNFFPLLFLLIPRRLLGLTVLSVDIEKIFLIYIF